MGVRRRVIVIGAGIAGLTAAALLSSRHDVVVYERAARPGGKVHATPSSLGPIDSGPTVFTMAWVFEKIFAEAGGAFRERVELQRLEVLARHYWRDGSKLDLFADPARTRDAIRDFAGPAESRRFEAFERRTRALFDGLLEPFMMASDPSLPRLIGSRNPFGLLRISPFQTLWRFLETQFKDPRLRQLFGRYATYCGASPFAAPATLALIANVEQQGVWTLTGGMSALADALEALGRTQGAEFVYDAHVSEILTQRRGVRLASGERREADAIVFNGDVAALRAGDAGPHAANAVEPAAEAEPSQSAMTWSTTGEADGVDLSAHTVFFSDDYRAEFDAVFRDGRVPDTPTTYVFAPDRAGGEANTGSAERLLLLINAPPIRQQGATPIEEADACRMRMMDHLSASGLRLTTHTEQVKTPADFAAMFPGTGGALYGVASHGWRASFQRPGVRSRLPGIYLAGGSVHPGPGVPMAALSGWAAAKAVERDLASI